jgi:hypothetical protein
MNDFLEQTITELTRKGDMEKVKMLKTLHRRVMPSQAERIRKNDKTVLREFMLPKWIAWELLRAWADSKQPDQKGKICILCNSRSETGMDFNERFICENCFLKVKNL